MNRLREINQTIINLFVVNPSSGSSLSYLDGLRAIAIIFVLLVHSWQLGGAPQYVITVPGIHYAISLSGIIAYMGVGVDLFFVLSGFLLAQHWLKADYLGTPRPNVARYFAQRFFRIIPAYYLVLFLTVLFLAPGYTPVNLITGHFGLFSLIAHLTLMHYVFPFSAASFGIDPQFWTLTVEVMFYLSLPLVIRCFLRNRWMIALPAAALLTVGWLFLCRNAMTPVVNFYAHDLSLPGLTEPQLRYLLAYQFPGHFLHFALGISLANLYVRRQLQIPSGRLFRALTDRRAALCWFVLGCAIVLYSMNKISWYLTHIYYDYQTLIHGREGVVPYYLHGIPFAIGFTLIMAGLLFGARWLQAVFSFTPLRLLGVLTYSLYLTHYAILIVLSRLPGIASLDPAHRFPALFAGTAVAALTLSIGIYFAVERPFIVLSRSFATRRPFARRTPGREMAATATATTDTVTERGILRFFAVASSSGAKVPYLDGVRAIAVIFVVLAHTWVLSGSPQINLKNVFGGPPIGISPYFGAASIGVQLFFLLSGFLLSQTWLRADFQHRPRPRIQPYFRNRFFRIVPAYYVCIFLMLLFMTPFLIPAEFVYSPLGAFILSAHLTFTHYLFPISAGDYNINGSFWTLTIEMIFYFVLPWAVILFLRNRWIITLPALALCSLCWFYLCRNSLDPVVHFYVGTVANYGVDEPVIRSFLVRQFPGYFVDFSFGIVIANLSWQYKTRAAAYRFLRYVTAEWMGTLFFALGCVLLLVTMPRLGQPSGLLEFDLKHLAISMGFALILAGVIAGGRWLQGLFSLTPLRFIGIVGYSIFLWHMPLIYLFNKYPMIAKLPPEQRFWRVLLLTTVSVLILSTLSYLFVEKPFILRSRKRPVENVRTAERRPELAVVGASMAQD